jgi:hypothetical protein
VGQVALLDPEQGEQGRGELPKPHTYCLGSKGPFVSKIAWLMGLNLGKWSMGEGEKIPSPKQGNVLEISTMNLLIPQEVQNEK